MITSPYRLSMFDHQVMSEFLLQDPAQRFSVTGNMGRTRLLKQLSLEWRNGTKLNMMKKSRQPANGCNDASLTPFPITEIQAKAQAFTLALELTNCKKLRGNTMPF